MQVIRKFSGTIASGPDVYAEVENAWHCSMQTMEDLLLGKPQRLVSPEPLLGLAAWHLYPDMTVLGARPFDVHQEDDLFVPGGILTLGLPSDEASLDRGITWSLPLSQLRYYGKPTKATRTLGTDSDRICFGDLKFVVLGAVTGKWFPKTGGINRVVDTLIGLTNHLSSSLDSDKSSLRDTNKPVRGLEREADRRLWDTDNSVPAWLRLLADAARDFVATKGHHREQVERLYKLGHRRGRNFLSSRGSDVPEAFGLLQYEAFAELAGDCEGKITMLRELLPKLTENSDLLRSGFISYRPCFQSLRETADCASDVFHNHNDHADAASTTVENDQYWEELATIIPPHPSISDLRQERRIPTHHVGVNSLEPYSWHIPHTISPHTGQVMRCIRQTNHTGELWGLFSKSVHTANYCVHSRETTSRTMIPPFESRPPDILRKSGPNWNSPLPYERFSQNGQPVWNVPYKSLQANPLANARPMKRAASNTSAISSSPPWSWRTKFMRLDPPQDLEPSSSSAEAARGVESKALPFCHRLQDCMDRNSYKIDEMGCPSKYYVPEPLLEPQEREYKLFIGDASTFSVWFPAEADCTDLENCMEKLFEVVQTKPNFAKGLRQYFKDFWSADRSTRIDNLNAFVYASQIFQEFPETSVDVSVIRKPLRDGRWFRNSARSDFSLNRCFACLGTFQTGSLDIDPEVLDDVMAMAVGNSLFMAEYIFGDPGDYSGEKLIRRTVGNIGKPGISFLISAKALDTLEPNDALWRCVPYAPFDGVIEDNFPETSLHLTFTGDEMPLDVGQTGFKDKEVFLIETVVRAYDRSRWVADLDLFGPCKSGISKALMKRFWKCSHSETERQNHEVLESLTSIDSWDELLDPPGDIGIVRAQNNWLARQAITAFCVQEEIQFLLAPGRICWACIDEKLIDDEFSLIIS